MDEKSDRNEAEFPKFNPLGHNYVPFHRAKDAANQAALAYTRNVTPFDFGADKRPGIKTPNAKQKLMPQN